MSQLPTENALDKPITLVIPPSKKADNPVVEKQVEPTPPSYWEELNDFLQHLDTEFKTRSSRAPTAHNLELTKDYIKFKALRDLSGYTAPLNAKQNSRCSLINCLEELRVLGCVGDSEEESCHSSPISLSARTSLLDSQRGSMLSFTLNSSPSASTHLSPCKNSLLDQKRVSFLSSNEPLRMFEHRKSNLASNLLQVPSQDSQSQSQDLRKRNSAIVATLDKPLPSSISDNNTRKSMREFLQRGSMCTMDLSPVKLGIPFSIMDRSQEDSESKVDWEANDDSSEASEDDQILDSAPHQFFKLSLASYNGLKFAPRASQCTSRQLNTLNLLSYNSHRQDDNPFGFSNRRLHPSERKFKKLTVSNAKLDTLPAPFYLISEEKFIRSSYKANNNGILLQQRSIHSPVDIHGTESASQPEESSGNDMVLSVGSFKFKEHLDPRAQIYQVYVGMKTTNGAERSDQASFSVHDRYTMTVETDTVYSHIFNERCLKDASLEENCQIKVEFAGERLPVNMYALVLLQNGNRQSKLPALPTSILRKIASYLSNDRIFVKDSGSQRGTFIQLWNNSPLMLQQEELLMLNNRVGFYVKSLNSETGSQSRLNSECELFCLNHDPEATQEAEKRELGKALPDLDLDGEDYTKLVRKIRRKELRGLIEVSGCPYVILELVVWNTYLNIYEEKGGVCLIFNNQKQTSQVQAPQENVCFASAYSKKNWCYLTEVPALKKILTALNIQYEVLLSYDKEDRWSVQTSSSRQQFGCEESACCEVDELGEHLFDFSSAFLRSNLCKKSTSFKGVNRQQPSQIIGDRPYEGLWVSTSPFKLLQDKFESRWIEVARGTNLKVGLSIFRLEFEKHTTTHGLKKKRLSHSLSRSPTKSTPSPMKILVNGY